MTVRRRCFTSALTRLPFVSGMSAMPGSLKSGLTEGSWCLAADMPLQGGGGWNKFGLERRVGCTAKGVTKQIAVLDQHKAKITQLFHSLTQSLRIYPCRCLHICHNGLSTVQTTSRLISIQWPGRGCLPWFRQLSLVTWQSLYPAGSENFPLIHSRSLFSYGCYTGGQKYSYNTEYVKIKW